MRYSLGVLVPSIVLAACSGASEGEVEFAKERCVEFFEEERASRGAHVEAVDTWEKEGKLVVEIAEREHRSDSSYSSHVCVVDLEEGSMQLPSIMSRERWYD